MSTFVFIVLEETLEAVLKVKVKSSVLIKAMERTTSQRIRKQSIWFFCCRGIQPWKKNLLLCKLNYFLSSDISWSSSFFLFCQRTFWKLHEEHVQSNWKEIWNLIINCWHYWWQLWVRYAYSFWKWKKKTLLNIFSFSNLTDSLSWWRR